MCTQRKSLNTNLPLIRSGPRTNCNCSVRCWQEDRQGYKTNILPRVRYSPGSVGSLWREWLSSTNWRQFQKDSFGLLLLNYEAILCECYSYYSNQDNLCNIMVIHLSNNIIIIKRTHPTRVTIRVESVDDT